MNRYDIILGKEYKNFEIISNKLKLIKNLYIKRIQQYNIPEQPVPIINYVYSEKWWKNKDGEMTRLGIFPIKDYPFHPIKQ